MGRKKKGGIPGLSFSWKRALGISQAQSDISRKLGVPLSKGGRQRKIGAATGCIFPAVAILGCGLGVGMALAWQSVAAQEASRRLEIRGIALNDPQAQVLTIHPSARCRPEDGVIADEICVASGFGDNDDAIVMYYIVGGRVETASVMLDSQEFPGTSLALRAKFGDPSSSKDDTVQNGAGATFRNRKFAWTDVTSSQTLDIVERSGKITRSVVTLSSDQGNQARTERFKASKQAEASKL